MFFKLTISSPFVFVVVDGTKMQHKTRIHMSIECVNDFECTIFLFVLERCIGDTFGTQQNMGLREQTLHWEKKQRYSMWCMKFFQSSVERCNKTKIAQNKFQNIFFENFFQVDVLAEHFIVQNCKPSLVQMVSIFHVVLRFFEFGWIGGSNENDCYCERGDFCTNYLDSDKHYDIYRVEIPETIDGKPIESMADAPF